MHIGQCHHENLTSLNFSERNWTYCHPFNDFLVRIEPQDQLVMVLCLIGVIANPLIMILLKVICDDQSAFFVV